MKGEYSLKVAMPINDAMKSIMEMPGSSDAEGIYYSGRIKRVSKSTHIYLQQVSESEISFSDSIVWGDRAMLVGNITFKPVSNNKTRVTAKFRIGFLKLWLNSGKIKIFLKNFSEALGVGYKWV